jgi:cytochrome c oxidase subunit I+III
VLAAVGTGFLSFGLWVHHMFTTGLPQISLAFFSAASEAVAIPTGVQIFVFIATMLAGRVIFSVPMLFGAGGLLIFVIGGLTGVMVALVPFDWQAHDTYFVVAHLHYVLIGGMLFPMIAGIYYYYPARHRQEAERSPGARHRFWLMFMRLQHRLLPDAFLRAARHADGGSSPIRPTSAGTGSISSRRSAPSSSPAGVATFVIDILRPKHRSRNTRDLNPWNAGTLEWINDPSESWGMRSVPIITSRYPLWDQPDLQAMASRQGASICPMPKSGKRETLVTSVLDAKPIQCLRVGGVSLLTIIAPLHSAACSSRSPSTGGSRPSSAPSSPSWPSSIGSGRAPRRSRRAPEVDVGLGQSLPALCVRSCLRRLVGDVHHHGRRRNGLRQPDLRLFLLLDHP